MLHKEIPFGCAFVCTRACCVPVLPCRCFLTICQGLCTQTCWHFRDPDVCDESWDQSLETVSLQCLQIQCTMRWAHVIPPPVDEETANQREVTVSPTGLEPVPLGGWGEIGGEEVIFREADQGVLWEGDCLLKKPVFKIKQFSLASLPHRRRPPPPPCWIISRQTH